MENIRIFLMPFGILAFAIWLTVTAYNAYGITGFIVGISIGSVLVIPAVVLVAVMLAAPEAIGFGTTRKASTT